MEDPDTAANAVRNNEARSAPEQAKSTPAASVRKCCSSLVMKGSGVRVPASASENACTYRPGQARRGARSGSRPLHLLSSLLAVRRLRCRGLTRRVRGQDLDGDGFGRDSAVVLQHMYVASAGVDEPPPRGVGLAAAVWNVAGVVGYGSGDDEDEAGSGVRVPPGTCSWLELVVDGVNVGEAACLEPRSPVG